MANKNKHPIEKIGDATMILQYYSYLSTGGKDSFADFLKK